MEDSGGGVIIMASLGIQPSKDELISIYTMYGSGRSFLDLTVCQAS